MFNIALILITAVLSPSTGGGGSDGDRGFARLKALEGSWVATEAGHTTPGIFQLAAGGTTVVQQSGYLVVFHRDGSAIDAVLFTSENNQSRFRSTGLAKDAKTMRFTFIDSTNVKPGAIFASGLEMDFEGTDLLVQRWKFKQGQKETGLTITYRRKRDANPPGRP